MNKRRSRVCNLGAKYRAGQHVRISKGKMNFAKASEQNFSEEIFRIDEVIHRTSCPVYELEGLNGTLIDGQFYGAELTPVRITKHITYKIDKMLYKRYRCGVLQYLVRLKVYRKGFFLWNPAAIVKHI